MADYGNFRFSPLKIAQAERRPGERLIWADQLSAARVAPSSLPAALFVVPFLGFAILWMAMAWWSTSKAKELGTMFPLFGLALVIVGLGRTGRRSALNHDNDRG